MSFNNFALNISRKLPPEFSNRFSLSALKLIYDLKLTKILFSINKNQNPSSSYFGLDFPNKIGVAGGLDKNANYFHVLGNLGFGFVEVGTITLKPQSGNPKPRIHRFNNEETIINSLGFNNVGSVKVLENIETNKKSFSGILGVSIGKGKETSNERAHEDYLHLLDYFKDVADYFAINISSPNTNDLRKLSTNEYFHKLIDEIVNKREQISKGFSKYKPIVVKVSPDETLNNLEKIISYSLSNGVDGFILTNTSLDHEYNMPGGISGKPLRQKSEESLKFVRSIVDDKAVIISSGGLMTKEDAIKRFSLKADLIQLYSGFVFKGNSLLQDCLNVSST